MFDATEPALRCIERLRKRLEQEFCFVEQKVERRSRHFSKA